MNSESSPLALELETVAELRELYRAAEARAARMRLMSANGRQLALAEPETGNELLKRCADRLAYFLGRSSCTISEADGASGLPIRAPGESGRTLAVLIVEGLASLDDIEDPEDREAAGLQLEMIGATIDRISRERERSRLLAMLQEREHQLEAVVAQLLTAQEEERRRVSHELHDGVAQTATALVRLLEGSSVVAGSDIPAVERARLAGIGRELVSELRRVIRGLRPTILDDLGLEAGLRSLVESIQVEGYQADVRISGEGACWLPAQETALFRVAQEAINNIRKHAGGPCRVEVVLDACTEDGHSALRITDYGQGLAQCPEGRGDAPSPRFGIEVMRERLASIGGSLAWRVEKHGGVTVLARLPRAG